MADIVLGLSGGVDSAVTARLLQAQGHRVLGLYLDTGTTEALEQARSTAEFLGVSLEVAEVREELEELVCRPFAESYLRGETPNPCVLCNPAVKFRLLLDCADRHGAEHIATGHYARAEGGALCKGQPANDQSYMLCRILPEQLRRLILPLGGYEKAQVRAMAAELGIPVANKPDSMEICFIPDKDYIGWLSRRAQVPGDGDFVFRSKVIGSHGGIHRWTVGQRIPGLFDGRKLYVAAIDPEKNEIALALWEELFKTEVEARDFRWLIDPPDSPVRGSVKVRHTKWECPECTVYPLADGRVRIETDEPLRAPARGQTAAVYQGERVIGGGFIV